MLHFGRKKLKKENENSTELNAMQMPSGTAIYTMPQKFVSTEKVKRFWTMGKIWVLIIFFLVAVVGGTYWLLLNANQQPIVDNIVNNQEEVAVDNNVSPPDQNQPAEGLVPSESTEELVKLDETSETSTESPIIPSLAETTVLPLSADADLDGLTDVEEQLYGTNPNKPDTDSDGYTDFAEMKNAYNPLGSGKLSDVKLFGSYTDSLDRFTASYPQGWSATKVNNDSVRFTASPDEFVIVLVQSNPKKLLITDWYKEAVPSAIPATLETETIGSDRGIFTPDRRSFYFVPKNNTGAVYVISYNVGTLVKTNFAATFDLIIRGLQVKK